MDDKFNLYRARSNGKSSVRDLLQSSKLQPEVLEEIEKVFVTDRASEDIDKTLIDESTIRLLEELSVPHAKIALNEFAHRCKVAPEKIRKSTAGYLRGVCLKYWKIGRAATKQQITDAYRKRIELGERVNKRKLIEDFISHTFTSGSQLDLPLIDSTVRKKLFQLEPCDALDVIFEFVSAVTFRTSKIRNINAYMMSMINKARTNGQMKTIDEILNRQKYGANNGIAKIPDSKGSMEKLQNPQPEWLVTEQSHKETQEWFQEKLAENPQEFLNSPISNPDESPSTIWSPSNPDPMSVLPDETEKIYGNFGTIDNYSPVQTPMYTSNSDSFFSKNDPTQSITYVSGSEQEQGSSSETNPENSTGSSESSNNNPPTAKAKKETREASETRKLKETIRQQASVIKQLNQKVIMLENRLKECYDEQRFYDDSEYFSQTPSLSTPFQKTPNSSLPPAEVMDHGKEHPYYAAYERFSHENYVSRARHNSAPAVIQRSKYASSQRAYPNDYNMYYS